MTTTKLANVWYKAGNVQESLSVTALVMRDETESRVHMILALLAKLKAQEIHKVLLGDIQIIDMKVEV